MKTPNSKRLTANKKSKHYKYKFGIVAEKIVIFFLILKFYRIIEWRYKNYFGEIDIIAEKNGIIIFIEVKARRQKASVEEVLHNHQILRIKKAAESFVAKNKKFHQYLWRFDFIEVNKFYIPKHHKNFF